MAEHFRLSEASGQTCLRMQRLLRISDRPSLLRLAFAKALASGSLPARETDNKGPEIPLSVITRNHEMLYDALIVQAMGAPFDPRDRRRIYKDLVDYGLEIVGREFQAVGENSDYLVDLARQVTSKVE